MAKSFSFLGAVVDGETKVFRSKNPVTRSRNNKQGMTGHSFRIMHLPIRPMGVSPQCRKIKQYGATFSAQALESKNKSVRLPLKFAKLGEDALGTEINL
jgi:hypothetical protein